MQFNCELTVWRHAFDYMKFAIINASTVIINADNSDVTWAS